MIEHLATFGVLSLILTVAPKPEQPAGAPRLPAEGQARRRPGGWRSRQRVAGLGHLLGRRADRDPGRLGAALPGIQLAGAAYLVVLGARAWRAQNRHLAGQEAVCPGRSPGFRAGLVSNLLNPKVGLFFLAVIPQFIPHHAHPAGYMLAFAATDAIIAAAWLLAVAWLSDKARAMLRRPRAQAALDRVAGTALVALGLKVAAGQLA